MNQLQQDVRPRYEVERLDGTVERVVTKIVDGQFQQEIVEEPAGFMLYLPHGGSIRARSEAHLRELGVDPALHPGLIDMESGEQVVPPQSVSLKQQSQARTQRSKSSKASASSAPDPDPDNE